MSGWRWEITSRITERRVVAIVRARTAEEALATATVLVDAGLDAIELPLTMPGALGAIEALVSSRPGALVGAGTVLDEASARAAILAGARFLVSPGLDRDVIATAHRYGAAALPGVQTPTEMVQALSAGADLLKVFPAGQLGPGFVKAVSAPLPQAPLVPTGGVSAGNAAEWLNAGAVALGVGGALTATTADAGERAAELLDAVATWERSRA
jgi:2-dehydro-3-deoxyphosphogluconate aldolase/(4S)-4-hydroxy-2-oxoglutarate aldolase